MNPVRWQRLEGFLVGAVAFIGAINLDFAWWWLLLLFLAFDLSALGYLAGPRIGAFFYNLVHNYAGPALAFGVFVFFGYRWLALVALAWAFHVAVDRALGYGLKHSDSFQHTHLGFIGRSAGGRSA